MLTPERSMMIGRCVVERRTLSPFCSGLVFYRRCSERRIWNWILKGNIGIFGRNRRATMKWLHRRGLIYTIYKCSGTRNRKRDGIKKSAACASLGFFFQLVCNIAITFQRWTPFPPVGGCISSALQTHGGIQKKGPHWDPFWEGYANLFPPPHRPVISFWAQSWWWVGHRKWVSPKTLILNLPNTALSKNILHQGNA